MDTAAKKSLLSSPRTLFALCLAVMCAAWIKFLAPTMAMYAIDYAERVAIIALLIVCGGFRFRAAAPVFTMRNAAMAGLVIVATLALFLLKAEIDINVPALGGVPYHFDRLQSPGFRFIDFTFGLALVALSEELVFRYLPVKAFPNSVKRQYLLTMLTFGLLHAPQGVLAVAVTGLTSALDMWLYKSTRTIAVPVAAHYIVDVVLFSEILYITDISFQF